MNVTLYQNMLANAEFGSVALQRIRETHTAWVILTKAYAFKIKKPVNYGFLDYDTLEKRKIACLEEIQRNQKNAPHLYIRLCPIYEKNNLPTLEPCEKIIEYAVLMHRFDEKNLLSEIIARRALTTTEIDALADSIVSAHAQAAVAVKAPLGNSDIIHNLARDNFKVCEALRGGHTDLTLLQRWTERSYLALKPLMRQRKAKGFVRACHGDLHFGNIVMQNNQPILFDAIEFNPDYYWTDTMADIAFIIMDCWHRKQNGTASRLLNRYLEKTGDYEGLQLLPYLIVYRAMVRAKVALLTKANTHDCTLMHACDQRFLSYLALAKKTISLANIRTTFVSADSKTHRQYPQKLKYEAYSTLICMHGVSGSGKTTLSQALLDTQFMIRLRADSERKRLHRQYPSLALYGDKMNALTEERLFHLAHLLLPLGFTVVIDATLIKMASRKRFFELAQFLGCPFLMLSCHLPQTLLFERITQRALLGNDLSDATPEVAKAQLANEEPLTTEEVPYTLSFALEDEAALEKAVKRVISQLQG